MMDRPKIKIVPSPADRLLEHIAIYLLVLNWLLAVVGYVLAPQIVPVHFNASGNADGFGNKISMLLLPLIPTFIYFLLGFISKYPHIFNYPVEITEANAYRQYSNAVRMMRFLKVAVLLIFIIINAGTFLTATQNIDGLGAWFIPVTGLLLLAPTVYYVYRAFKLKSK